MISPEPIFRIHAELADILHLGTTPYGDRRVINIVGGRVEGERLSGRILPGGADWQIVRADGVLELEARYTLELDDGTFVGVVNRGFRHGSPEVLARLAAGEAVPPEAYYFRTNPVFTVPAGPHAWLDRTIFVGTAERAADAVVIRYFELL